MDIKLIENNRNGKKEKESSEEEKNNAYKVGSTVQFDVKPKKDENGKDQLNLF